MNNREFLQALRPYLNHKSNCPALEVMWHKGPCECGYEAVMGGIDKRNMETDQEVKRILEELEVNGFTSEDLDDDVHEVASQSPSSVNNGGLESQVRFLLERGCTPSVLEAVELRHMGESPDGDEE